MQIDLIHDQRSYPDWTTMSVLCGCSEVVKAFKIRFETVSLYALVP